MESLKLIVIEDKPAAYEMCEQLKANEFSIDVVDIDLQNSRTILQDEEHRRRRKGKNPLENLQTYEDISNFLSSEQIPDKLIILLDLTLNFEEEYSRGLRDKSKYNLPSSGLGMIHVPQVASIILACRIINNRHAKKLLICIATTGEGGDYGVEFNFLKDQIEDAKFNNSFLQSEVVTISGISDSVTMPFVSIREDDLVRYQLSKKFIQSAVKKFNNSFGNNTTEEFIKVNSSPLIRPSKAKLLKEYKCKYIIRGSINALEAGSSLALLGQINKGEEFEITDNKTFYIAELFYILILNGTAGTYYDDILKIDKSPKAKDAITSLSEEKKHKAVADFLGRCKRHVKDKIKKILDEDFEMHNVFNHNRQQKKVYLFPGLEVIDIIKDD